MRERPSTEAVSEESRTEKREKEQESSGNSIPKESSHEQTTSVAPERGKGQYNSGSDDDEESSSESSSDEASFKYVEEIVLKAGQNPIRPVTPIASRTPMSPTER